MSTSPRIVIAACFAAFCVYGCTTQSHVTGRVVDTRGRPVSHAKVKAEGISGGMITGEGVFSVETHSDVAGRFDIVVPERRGSISVEAVDGKQKGEAPVSEGEVVVVVR